MLTLLRLSWLSLRRDRVAWLLSFVVPVVFFSVFAVVFGGGSKDGLPPVGVAVVDEDRSEVSTRLVAALGREPGLAVVARKKVDGGEVALDRGDAEGMVRGGKLPAAVILPRGLGASLARFDGTGPAVEVLADSSNPVAAQVVAGLLQKVVMTGAPEALVRGGIGQLERHAGGLTPAQRRVVVEKSAAKDEGGGAAGAFGLVPVKVVDVVGGSKANPVVAFYAAATAVMFLLFSCANGGGGSLLQEVDSGTLDRLLSSRLGMTQLLLGKWLWLTLVGVAQVTVMFVWGALAFRVELAGHLAGFAVMAVTTAAAAAGFGLVLGTVCRSREQLGGVSTTVILIMSAVGGSMFPRFLMSDTLRKVGLLTFNAWALDGFQKVFWYEAPAWQLWPQAGVLAALAAVFLTAARLLARRWESA
jgi:ABC-2 type transport system permease protein